jgi:hypothetical protein
MAVERDCELADFPVILGREFPSDLFQVRAYRCDQHGAPAVWAPDDVVYNDVYTVVRVLLIPVDLIPHGNTVCKVRGPFHPWLKPTGFLANFL